MQMCKNVICNISGPLSLSRLNILCDCDYCRVDLLIHIEWVLWFRVFYYNSDIDECEVAFPCDENANCSNTPGSFICTCNAGYSGDGLSCTGQYLLQHSVLLHQIFNCDCTIKGLACEAKHIVGLHACNSVLPQVCTSTEYLRTVVGLKVFLHNRMWIHENLRDISA